MIREAVVEDDAARREGLLTLADQWVEIAARRKRGGRVTDPFCPPGRPCPPGKCDED